MSKKYKGEYNSATDYAVGDVVINSDGRVYFLQNECGAGTDPKDNRYWEKLPQPAAEMILMIADTFSGINEQINNINNAIPRNIDENGILLKGEDENEYLITVDTSGEEPEVIATLVEPEDDGGDGDGDGGEDTPADDDADGEGDT